MSYSMRHFAEILTVERNNDKKLGNTIYLTKISEGNLGQTILFPYIIGTSYLHRIHKLHRKKSVMECFISKVPSFRSVIFLNVKFPKYSEKLFLQNISG